MARLPVPGADNNTWGNVLNDFLSQAHNPDGSLKTNTVATTQVQDGAVTTPKLATSIQSAINAAVGEVDLDKQWIIAGPVNVAAGEVDYIAPAYVTVPAGFNAVITTLRARINSGTDVNLRITKNGTTQTGLSAVVVTTSGVAVTGLNLAVTDGDLLAPVVNSTSGGPQNMTVMVSYKLTKA